MADISSSQTNEIVFISRTIKAKEQLKSWGFLSETPSSNFPFDESEELEKLIHNIVTQWYQPGGEDFTLYNEISLGCLSEDETLHRGLPLIRLFITLLFFHKKHPLNVINYSNSYFDAGQEQTLSYFCSLYKISLIKQDVPDDVEPLLHFTWYSTSIVDELPNPYSPPQDLKETLKCIFLKAIEMMSRISSKKPRVLISRYLTTNDLITEYITLKNRPFKVVLYQDMGLKWVVNTYKKGVGWILLKRILPIWRVDPKIDAIRKKWHEVIRINTFRSLFQYKGIDVFPLFDALLSNYINARFSQYSKDVRMIKRKLKKLNIKTVCVPLDCSCPQKMLVLIARSLNIPSLVIQHGARVIINDSDQRCADYAAVWSNQDRDILITSGKLPKSIIVTGNVNRQMYPVEKVNEKVTQNKNIFHILVISASPYPKLISVMQEQPELYLNIVFNGIDKMSKNLRLGQRVLVTVRLHPAEYSEYYKILFPDATFQIPDNKPITDAIKDSDCLICFNSGTLYEALALGCPVILVNVSNIKFPPPFDGKNGIPICRTSEQLAHNLIQVANSSCVDMKRGHSILNKFVGKSYQQSIRNVNSLITSLVSNSGVKSTRTENLSGRRSEDDV